MRIKLISIEIDCGDYDDVVSKIITWSKNKESRYVCVANVHMVMEAYDDPAFRSLVNAADLVVPDGMPLVWMLGWMGAKGQPRIYGPDLTLKVAQAAAQAGLPIGLYGGTPLANEHLVHNLQKCFPGLEIVYRFSPPFRALTSEEDAEIVKTIHASQARILLVGLGCPKQERWMAEHNGKIPAVMLGVGAAFDIHSGLKPQAPLWMQKIGMEWFFRLVTEPKRLWKRYVYHNPRFLALALLEVFRKFREAEI